MTRRATPVCTRRWQAFLLAFLASMGSALAQTGRVDGTVRDESGKPLRGATVVARNPDATPSSYAVSTDPRGRFSIIGLQSGRWTFTATAAGHEPGTGRGRVGSVGTNPHFEFRLKRLAAAVPAPAPAAAAGLASADALLAAGHLDRAVAAYEALHAGQPGRVDVALRLARACRLARDFDRALAVLAALPQDGATAGDVARETGLALLERGDLPAADEVLSRAALAPRADRDVYFAMGEVRLAQARPADAVPWFERAAAADPVWPRPLLKLGLIAANGGEREAAARYLQQVLRLAPDSVEARQARAVLEQLR
jgi:Flp pilus assembly protein TadD